MVSLLSRWVNHTGVIKSVKFFRGIEKYQKFQFRTNTARINKECACAWPSYSAISVGIRDNKQFPDVIDAQFGRTRDAPYPGHIRDVLYLGPHPDATYLRRNLDGTYTQIRRKQDETKSLSRCHQDVSLMCKDPPSFCTRLALQNDYDNALSFVFDVYYKEEPSVLNMGLCDVPPSPAIVKYTLEQIKDGMTILAVNQNDCIIGIAVNIGSCPWDPRKLAEYAECCEQEGPWRDLLEFYAYLSCKPDLWNRYAVFKLFECSIMAVHPEYRGIGIAKKLVEKSWCLARDCNYRLFRIDCSNRFTTKIAEGYGFEKVCSVPYCDFLKDGETVFKYIQEPHTEIDIYVDTLTYCKSYTLPYNSSKCKKD